MRTLLRWCGFDIVYVCGWGEYAYRYDRVDRAAGRPIHPEMGVAPPWATRKIRPLVRTGGCW